MRGHGWDHPFITTTTWWDVPIFDLLAARAYMNLLVLKLGAGAEAAGRLDEALRYYWQAAEFADRMHLQSTEELERLVAVAYQKISYERLGPALRKAGKEKEAHVVDYAYRHLLQEVRRQPRDTTLARSSDYNWSVLLANLFAGLVVVFLPLTALCVIYVNVKAWLRKEKKGRLYKVLTTAENYLAVLLFLSCLALYLAFVPYRQNYTHYLTTNEPIEDITPGLFQRSYPLWDNYGLLGGLPLQKPFQDYLPYALGGIVLLIVVALFSRWYKRRSSNFQEQS